MDKTRLQQLLSRLEPLPDPQAGLEQYRTPPDIAAEVLHQAALAGDITDKDVVDLGTGSGVFALGAAALGASATGYDIDADAIETARENAKLLEDALGQELDVTFMEQDVRDVDTAADTVVMNPPFGLQQGNEQANLTFLKKAFATAPTVYALLHQADEPEQTREYIAETAAEQGFETEILSWFRFPIPHRYRFHDRETARVKVDLYKFFSQTGSREV